VATTSALFVNGSSTILTLNAGTLNAGTLNLGGNLSFINATGTTLFTNVHTGLQAAFGATGTPPSPTSATSASAPSSPYANFSMLVNASSTNRNLFTISSTTWVGASSQPRLSSNLDNTGLLTGSSSIFVNSTSTSLGATTRSSPTSRRLVQPPAHSLVNGSSTINLLNAGTINVGTP